MGQGGGEEWGRGDDQVGQYSGSLVPLWACIGPTPPPPLEKFTAHHAAASSMEIHFPPREHRDIQIGNGEGGANATGARGSGVSHRTVVSKNQLPLETGQCAIHDVHSVPAQVCPGTRTAASPREG